jgi:Methylase involved in ubiquinone/menaquinone biosynthesis
MVESSNRKQKDKEFNDKKYSEHSAGRVERLSKYYGVIDGSIEFYRRCLSRGKSRNVLDYGCGQGLWSFYLAGIGASVTGIDGSNVAIEQAQKTLDFSVMDCENMTFDEDTFDFICGTAILHHLNLEKALSEIVRTLKPDGTAVFLEPLGHNPMINLYRRLTPSLRVEDEHPLRTEDIRIAERYFEVVDTQYFELLALLAVPLRRFRIFRSVLTILKTADKVLFRLFPFMGRYAWHVVITLSHPRQP